MEQIIRQIVGLLSQGIEMILKFLQLVWTWSFGQIISIFQSDVQSLPIWKIAVLAIAVIAIVYLLYKAGRQIWSALVRLFKSFVDLLTAFVYVLPYILIAGGVAFGASWVIKSVNF